MATLRGYGVSVREIRSPEQWGDACDLVDAAIEDTGTELFAAVAGWRHPMSQVELLMLVSAYGKSSHLVMPFDAEGHITPEEVESAHDQLLQEIKFS